MQAGTTIWWIAAVAAVAGCRLSEAQGGGSDSAEISHGGGDGDPGTADIWPSLDPAPAWQSTDRGYGTGLAWVDLNQDGIVELVVAYGNDMRPGRLAVYSQSDGVLDEVPNWSSDLQRFHGHLSVGDVDGDGWPDVAVSVYLGDEGFDEPGGVEIYRNLDGVLEATPSVRLGGFYSFSCALGDADRDGDLDLAVATGEAYTGVMSPVLVFENPGDGVFSGDGAWRSAADGVAYDVAWLDQNDDGWLDLVVANHARPHALYRGSPDGLVPTPAWQASGDVFEGNTVDWGDVNGDGHLDLAFSDNQQFDGSGRVTLYCGPELEACWTSEDTPAYQSAVSLEDVDGDGGLELVAGAWWGAVRIYDNHGGALAVTPSWTSAPDTVVVEALTWAELSPSDAVVTVAGSGLVAVPGRTEVLSVTGGIAFDGWVSGPGEVQAIVRAPAARSLAVSDWQPDGGNLVFGRNQ